MRSTLTIWPGEKLAHVSSPWGLTEVHLTKKEMKVLAFLAKSRGKPCYRFDIESAVWPGRGDLANVLDVYIGYLRKKLGSRMVDTVRGVGYRLAVDVTVVEGEI